MSEADPADKAKPGAFGTGEPDKEGDPESSSGAQLWRDAIATLRKRVDLTAKTLGGVGMTAASAVGIAKIGDLFPIPPGCASHVWFGLAIVGFVALAGAILIVTYRLWSVNKPVLMRSSLEAMRDPAVGGGEEISEKEEKEVRVIYQETARLNGAPSLRAYEAHHRRLLRIAERTADHDKRAKHESAAKKIAADIQATLLLAALVVIRRRTSNAVRGFGSIVAYGLLVGGIVLFALGTDYVSSERSEQITIAKNCADARTAGATSTTLPAICGDDPSADETAETSAAEERTKAANALGEQFLACRALIRTGNAPSGSCRAIARAMSSLAK